MTGLHIVRKLLKTGERYYVYAWRGGPCIHCQDDSYPVITPEILTKQQAEKTKSYGESKYGFKQIIDAYRASPEFKSRADSTQVEYKRWLNRIHDRFGNTPTSAFEDRKMRFDIIEWRNLWADQPRTADIAAAMISILLGWAVDQGLLKINVASRIKDLHKVSRADLIWEEHHWQTMLDAKAPAHLMTALRIASWTGLRLGDLVRLDWANIGPKAIILVTRKRKGRAVIPIIPAMRVWIDAVPLEQRKGAVLRNSRGYPWTESGLGSRFQKSKPDGFDRRIHDLRGTFCTMLILKGLTDDQTAMIMGWTAGRVSEIRARYVDEERVIMNLSERLSA